jgi:hypothetical protein
MSLIGEAAIQGYLSERKIRFEHHLFDPFDASLDEVGIRSLADGRVKCACKMTRTETRQLSEVPGADFLAEVCVDESQDACDLPRRKPATRSHVTSTNILLAEIRFGLEQRSRPHDVSTGVVLVAGQGAPGLCEQMNHRAQGRGLARGPITVGFRRCRRRTRSGRVDGAVDRDNPLCKSLHDQLTSRMIAMPLHLEIMFLRPIEAIRPKC